VGGLGGFFVVVSKKLFAFWWGRGILFQMQLSCIWSGVCEFTIGTIFELGGCGGAA